VAQKDELAKAQDLTFTHKRQVIENKSKNIEYTDTKNNKY